MSMYYIKTGLEYWKPKGYGYTKSREEAGVFTLKRHATWGMQVKTALLMRRPNGECVCNA